MNKNQKTDLFIFIGLFLLTLILWNIPFGRYVLYPFTILGTWFHEMGHGIASIIMGAHFERLLLYPNGSGLAQYSYTSIFLGPIGRGIIAGAGPLAPTIVGGILLYSSKSSKLSKILLWILIIMIFVSVVLWIRPLLGFGFFIMIALGLGLVFIYSRKSDKLNRYTMQFLGLQAFLSLYLSIDYLYSAGGIAGESSFSSDTQVMAKNLLLPHWFWATAILIVSIYLIYASFKYSFVRNNK